MYNVLASAILMRRLISPLTAIALAAASIGGASAQQVFPTRTLKLVVPFPAGGPTDVFARLYADGLANGLGHSVVVENKAGAGGAIGSLDVVRAPADGHTLLFGTTSTHGIYGLIKAKPQYNAATDFSHIAIVGAAPATIVAKAGVANDLKGLVALAKSKPGELKYGSPGVGTFLHLAGELLKREAGNIDILHVPYRGSSAAMTDLLGGHINAVVDTLGTTLAQHKDGTVRIVAIATPTRSPLAPDVPTVDQALGTTGFIAELWNIVCAPPGTPAPIVDRIVAETSKILADPAVINRLRQIGIEPVTNSSPAAARKFIEQELERWRPVVEKAGIKPD